MIIQKKYIDLDGPHKLKLVLSYDRGRGYWASVCPVTVKPEEYGGHIVNIETFMPLDCKSRRVLPCDRASKKREAEAWEKACLFLDEIHKSETQPV